MASKKPAARQAYKVLHSAVGAGRQGEIVNFDDTIDTDRLIAIGAIEPTDEPVPDPYDTTPNPRMATGGDTAAFEAATARASGHEPTGPAANPENVQNAIDAANAPIGPDEGRR